MDEENLHTLPQSDNRRSYEVSSSEKTFQPRTKGFHPEAEVSNKTVTKIAE